MPAELVPPPSKLKIDDLIADLEKRQTAEEKDRAETKQQLAEMRVVLNEMAESKKKESLTLPGSEGSKLRNGEKITVGHFVRAQALRQSADEAHSRRLLPEVWDINDQAWKHNPDSNIQRVATTMTDSTGGMVVPEQISGDMQRNVFASSTFGKVGVRDISGLIGDSYAGHSLAFSPIVYMVGEKVTFTKSATGTFGKWTARPRKAGAMYGLTREMLTNGSVSIDSEMQSSALTNIQLKIEQQGLEGTGGENQVNGLMNYSGLQSFDGTAFPNTASNGRDLAGIHLIRMRQIFEEANEDSSNFGTIMPTKVKNILALKWDTQGASVSSGIPTSYPNTPHTIATNEQLDAAYGPIGFTTQLAQTLTIGSSSDGCRIFFGDFSKLWVMRWGGLVVARSDVAVVGSENAFTDELEFVRISQRFDAIPVRQAALGIATGFRVTRSGV